ncbi:hypothetical protein [Streptacidiphilus sp. EB129]|uniref:hypothetical protein n=1 Tax=Streptacidiphilus sp. EB129 TaxID=3156262 RepID=UPI003518B17A
MSNALVNDLRALLTRGHELLDRMLGEETTVVTQAKTDAEQVVADGEKAAAPVVAEAEHDAEKLAGTAVADVEGAVSQSAPDVAPAGPATPTV